MCSLLARKRRSLDGWAEGAARFHSDLHPLAPYQLQARPPLYAMAPVPPEQRRRGEGQRMQEHAHPARLPGVPGMPLALLAQPTGTAVAYLSGIDHTQAPIGVAAMFRRRERLPGRTAQRPIRLARKVSTREAAVFPGLAWHRWSIPLCGSSRGGLCWCSKPGGSKLGGPHRLRLEVMAPFQPQVPDPTLQYTAKLPVPRPNDCTSGWDRSPGLYLRVQAGSVGR